MTQRVILVVDDQEDNRVVFSTVLTRNGYRVLMAGDGLEAVEVAARHAPDLILMDLSMPLMDGWEAVRVLKADRLTASIPVAAVTAHPEEADRLRDAGFCAYLGKPIGKRELLEAVQRCLGAAPPGPAAKPLTARALPVSAARHG